jgi:integrase
MLSQLAITGAAPKERPYKLSDGQGLHLLVKPNGRKLWRFRYRFMAVEKMLALGAYPDVSLAGARKRRDDAKKVLAEGQDPSEQKRLDRAAAEVVARNTFGAVASDYIAKLIAEGAAAATVSKNRWLLEDLAAPLSKRPISAITPAEVLVLLQRIEKTGRRETAHRLRGIIGSVFRLAVATLRASNDPTHALRGALLKRTVNHRAAIIDERELGALMRSIDAYDGWPTIRAALQLLALTMTRPGDVRLMRRPEIIFATALWRIPAERMKMRRPHDVPLSQQAVAALRDVWELFPESDFVLPSIRSCKRPISENGLNAALRRMGYDSETMCAHGFRSSASTILNERGFNADVIEAALAHEDEDTVRRAYNRSTYFERRIALMQEWADLLDELKKPAQVINLRAS